MDGFRRLTQLYSDTKRSSDVVAQTPEPGLELDDRPTGTPELVKLHLEFKKQRERLSAWGVEWSDDNNTSDGDIDEAVAKAGLTDAVADVLHRIQETLEEAEKMRYPTRSVARKASNPEKVGRATTSWARGADDIKKWTSDDRERYEQLATDLTSSLDLLEDLSRTRREIRQGTYPSSGKASTSSSFSHSKDKEKASMHPPTRSIFLSSAYSESEETLVMPQSTRSSNTRTAVSMELPSRLDPSLLEMEEEEPPPYDRIGATQASRMIAYLKQPKMPSASDDDSGVIKIPVLVEFAPFDPAYRATGIPPPSERLDRLLAYHARSSSPYEVLSGGTLSCLGYFEDPKDSRYGLVYELPKSAIGSFNPTPQESKEIAPTTLLKVLQSTSASSSKDKKNIPNIPALEDRFRMAFNLMQAFQRMHTEEHFTHKDVNSGNVVFFLNKSQTGSDEKGIQNYDLRTPYVTSFDLFTEYNLEPVNETSLARNLYRHRDDARVSKDKCSICRNKPCDCSTCGPNNACVCSDCRAHACNCAPYRFDLHSLALILIEIGLWLPIGEWYKERYTYDYFMQRIDNHCVKRLGAKCGTAYMKVVQDMLQQASSNVTDEELRLHYLRWLTGLHRCCMIDEAEDFWASPFGTMQSSVTRSTSPTAMHQQQQQQQTGSLKQQSSWSPKSSVSSSAPTQTTGRKLAAMAAQQAAAVAASKPTPVPYSITEEAEEAGDSEMRTAQAERRRAATVIQNAWRSSRTHDGEPVEEDYSERVSTLQAQWLKRTGSGSSRSTNTVTPTKADVDQHTQQQITKSIEQIATTTITTAVEIPAPRQKLRIHNIKIPSAVASCWMSDLQPRLEKIVGRALKHSDESASIELAMVGETPEVARPTIFVTCTSASRVKGCLKRKFTFDDSLFDIKVRRGKIRRSKAASGTKRSIAPRSAGRAHVPTGQDDDQMVLNRYHQQRPLCGASIGAFVGDKHLPPVSFGGIVDVDGELFGMTVHHLLDDPSDDEEDFDDPAGPGASAMLSSGRRPTDSFDMFSGIGGNPMLQSFPTDSSLMFPLEISDHEISESEDGAFASDVAYSSEEDDDMDDEEDDDEDDYAAEDSDEALGRSLSSSAMDMAESRCTQGDIPGIMPGSTRAILVTQPALDDVDDDFFPCPEDRDEDHLDSHTLGHIYASSGIRRWNRKGVLHEVDWALMKLDDERLQPFNLVQGGKRYFSDAEQPSPITKKLVEPVSRVPGHTSGDDEFPTQVANCDDLANLEVHCFGRTSGLQGGIIGGVMASVRIYKRNSWSKSWSVRGNFGGMFFTVLLLETMLIMLQLEVILVRGSLTMSKVASVGTSLLGASASRWHTFARLISSLTT
jgi:hypothetical protein